MKISISISDALLYAAEKLAKRHGISRSELYQRAMHSYIEKHRADSVTESLDTLYAGADSEIILDSDIEHLQNVSLASTDW